MTLKEGCDSVGPGEVRGHFVCVCVHVSGSTCVCVFVCIGVSAGKGRRRLIRRGLELDGLSVLR